jgi:sugar phosphate isomerase/epimerase
VTVRLAITPDSRWPVAPAVLAETAAAAGFDAVGISGDRVDAAAIAAYRTTGLHCHEVLALVLGEDRDATVTAAERLASSAAAIKADWVLTVFRAEPTRATLDLVQRCAAIFAAAGSAMAAEFSPLGPISSIPKAMKVVEAGNARGGRAGLMIDSWHFSFGDSTWDDLARVPLDDIAYVQFADALAPVSENLMDETMGRRALPGQGVLELHRFASTLLERGWRGLVSVEVLSDELQNLSADDLVKRIAETTAPYWR